MHRSFTPPWNPLLVHICTQILTAITSTYINNSPIEGITPIEHALVLQLSNMHMILTGIQVFPMLDSYYPIYGSSFNLSAFDLWLFLIDSYA